MRPASATPASFRLWGRVLSNPFWFGVGERRPSGMLHGSTTCTCWCPSSREGGRDSRLHLIRRTASALETAARTGPRSPEATGSPIAWFPSCPIRTAMPSRSSSRRCRGLRVERWVVDASSTCGRARRRSSRTRSSRALDVGHGRDVQAAAGMLFRRRGGHEIVFREKPGATWHATQCSIGTTRVSPEPRAHARHRARREALPRCAGRQRSLRGRPLRHSAPARRGDALLSSRRTTSWAAGSRPPRQRAGHPLCRSRSERPTGSTDGLGTNERRPSRRACRGATVEIRGWDDRERRVVVRAESERHPETLVPAGIRLETSSSSSRFQQPPGPGSDRRSRCVRVGDFEGRNGLSLGGYLTRPRTADGPSHGDGAHPRWARGPRPISASTPKSTAHGPTRLRGAPTSLPRIGGLRPRLRARRTRRVGRLDPRGRRGRRSHGWSTRASPTPNRVCAVGHGFGGYVALSLLVREPSRVACAASFGGILDVEAFAGRRVPA